MPPFILSSNFLAAEMERTEAHFEQRDPRAFRGLLGHVVIY